MKTKLLSVVSLLALAWTVVACQVQPVVAQVPVRTLTYRSTGDAPRAELARWGWRAGPPYRGYYYGGPSRYYSRYYSGYGGYRAPYYGYGYYGRDFYGPRYRYGTPYGVGARRFGVYWR